MRNVFECDCGRCFDSPHAFDSHLWTGCDMSVPVLLEKLRRAKEERDALRNALFREREKES